MLQAYNSKLARKTGKVFRAGQRTLLQKFLVTKFLITISCHHCASASRYKLAEVTGGGIRLEEIDCKTMESVHCPRLFLCGEVCDVFGRIGGFNFYWAWVSGRAAGLAAAGSDWTQCDV